MKTLSILSIAFAGQGFVPACVCNIQQYVDARQLQGANMLINSNQFFYPQDQVVVIQGPVTLVHQARPQPSPYYRIQRTKGGLDGWVAQDFICFNQQQCMGQHQIVPQKGAITFPNKGAVLSPQPTHPHVMIPQKGHIGLGPNKGFVGPSHQVFHPCPNFQNFLASSNQIEVTITSGVPVNVIMNGSIIFNGNTHSGYLLMIQHENALVSYYRNISPVTVPVGTRLNGGQQLSFSTQGCAFGMRDSSNNNINVGQFYANVSSGFF